MNAVATVETTTEYVTFSTWQSVRKLANEIGVPFYSSQTYRNDKGVGLKWDRFSNNSVDVVGYVSTYGDNEYMRRTVSHLAHENFMLKLELWAAKNNMEFKYVKNTSFAYDSIKISKKVA